MPGTDLIFTPEDRRILRRILTAGRHGAGSADGGELTARLGLLFLGAPYEASTLEGRKGSREPLVISLQAFDCFTFVESVTALALTVRAGKNLRRPLPESWNASGIAGDPRRLRLPPPLLHRLARRQQTAGNPPRRDPGTGRKGPSEADPLHVGTIRDPIHPWPTGPNGRRCAARSAISPGASGIFFRQIPSGKRSC